ncbi:transcriptional coactivator p15/PC4 family protein [Candidatus Zixiibacteriota bacterium]
MDEIIVGGFLKNASEMVAGVIAPFNNKLLVHLRIFIPSAVEEGDWLPTQKGVSISADRFLEVAEAIRSLTDVAGTDVTVARIPRDRKTEIQVGVSEFKGNVLCNVRQFFQNEEGSWLPTKKGISLSTSRLPDLLGLVSQLEEKLDEVTGGKGS